MGMTKHTGGIHIQTPRRQPGCSGKLVAQYNPGMETKFGYMRRKPKSILPVAIGASSSNEIINKT